MSLEMRIKTLGEAFDGRLDRHLISNALDYCDLGENQLAVEMLADHLFESDVPITTDECQELLALAVITRAEINRVTLLRPIAKEPG